VLQNPGLAFAHERGLVHRDLKPGNVLVSRKTIKLADFGIGSVISSHAVHHSRIGTSAINQLTAADQASLYRGAGTPLYMSAEQRRGDAPDPRHDLYSLGVMWYQLLVGDVTRELHPGWATELAEEFHTPKEEIEIIQRCVGWIKQRPASAGELVTLLRSAKQASASEPPTRGQSTGSRPRQPPDSPNDAYRQAVRITQLKQLLRCHEAVGKCRRVTTTVSGGIAILGISIALIILALFGGVAQPAGPIHPIAPVWLIGALILAPPGLLLVVLPVHFLLWQKPRAQQMLADKIAAIVAEFPESVQVWGGPSVLGDPEIVQEILRLEETPPLMR
jgi:hypothetical protein